MAILSGMVRLQLCDFIRAILASRRFEMIATNISLQKVWIIKNRFYKPHSITKFMNGYAGQQSIFSAAAMYHQNRLR